MGTIPKLEDCRPGFRPVEYYVVIAPERIEERTAGGIILTQAKREVDEIATQKGRIVAVSPLAWTFADGAEHAARVGDVVLFGRYAGTLIEGDDGEKYRLCRDKDVVAVFDEPASLAVAA